MKYIIENFVHPNDAKLLINYFDQYDHLCSDDREFHRDRNLHFSDIPNVNMKNILLYYACKNEMFIDHYFKARTHLFRKMRMCRWNKGHSMPLHVDRNDEHGDLFHFSSLIYLNDDYEGGELFFMENNKEKKYKLKSLSCMIFPSGKEYTHGVKKILKGKRYTIPSWYVLKK